MCLGTVVECQEERSQAQNKQKAVAKLRTLLYQREFTADQERMRTSRKLQVGTMNRNEKIRTYNYNRHMITDHRLGEARTVPNISSFMLGDHGFQLLASFHADLDQLQKTEKLAELINRHSS
jgi:peptide chain release factor 1